MTPWATEDIEAANDRLEETIERRNEEDYARLGEEEWEQLQTQRTKATERFLNWLGYRG